MTGPSLHCRRGHANPVGQHYCGECGASLAGLCPSGHSNPPGQRFCGECGTPLIGAHDTPMSDHGDQRANPGTREGSHSFGPRFRVNDDGVVQDDDARANEHPPKASAPPHHGTPSGKSAPLGKSAQRERKAVRVGTTFTTHDGNRVEIVKVARNYVWLYMEKDGSNEGPFKFPRKDVEDALAPEGANGGHLGKPESEASVSASASPRASASTGQPGKVDAASTSPFRYSQDDDSESGSATRGGFKLTPLKLVGIGVVGVIVILWLVSLAISGGGEKHSASPSGGGSQSSQDSTTTAAGTVSGTNEDWLQAICQSGGYIDGIRGDMFSGATGGGYCIRPRSGSGPVYFSQWESSYKMRNSMAMLRMCYASVVESGGMIETFSVIGRNTAALQPLAQFGFTAIC